MYYIEQVEGELVEASKKLWQAVHDNDMEMAEAIYRQYVNDDPPQPVSRDNVWWIYNAPSRIKHQCGITADEYSKLTAKTQKGRTYQAARLAEQRVGGKWDVMYEY